MWAYLFWSLVAAWLFSLRPKRALDNGPSRAEVYGERVPPAGCGHNCCHAHAHGHGHTDEHANSRKANADPEISSARKERNWADDRTDRSTGSSEQGSVSSLALSELPYSQS
jgi:hypothetical protein